MSAPSPAAAGLPAEDVERVARALWEADHEQQHGHRRTWEEAREDEPDWYRRLAAAALAEMRPTAAEDAVKRVEAPPGGTQFSLTLNDQEVTVAEVPDLPERGLTSLTYDYRTAIQVRSVDDLDGRVLLHEVLHALLRTDPQQVCPADDPRHEDFVRMLTAGLHDAAGFRRATDGPR